MLPEGRYLGGVVAGYAGAVVLAGLLLLVLKWSIVEHDREVIVATWLAGAVGAVVSVMQRVSSASLETHHEAGRTELFLLGVIRPLLGAAIAVALYSLFAGGILDFAKPDNTMEIYYYAGIGSLSGFSERFAQDMLVPSAAGFTQNPKPPPKTGPRPEESDAAAAARQPPTMQPPTPE